MEKGIVVILGGGSIYEGLASPTSQRGVRSPQSLSKSLTLFTS